MNEYLPCVDCEMEHCDVCVLTKYEWHDLRKDPNDLPEYCEMVCCALQYADGDILTTAKEYHGNSNTFGGYHVIGYYDSRVMTEVIAWKYLEPFVEES